MPHLDRFGLIAKESLREGRPKLYRDLEASGQLEQFLYERQEDAKNVLVELVAAGVDWNLAYEVAVLEHLVLPSEEDQPRLGESAS